MEQFSSWLGLDILDRPYHNLFPSKNVPWFELVTAFVILVVIYTILTHTVLVDEDELPMSFTVPVPEQCSPEWKGELLEDPGIKMSGYNAIQCYCPANGMLLGQVNPATPDGIDRAIARAKEAQVDWAKTTWAQRRKVLKTMLKYILYNQETIATVACLDSGKTKIDASFGEILVTAEKLKWTIQNGEKALRPERRPTNFLMMYKRNEVRWEPLGVVAACLSGTMLLLHTQGLARWLSKISQFHNLIGPIISTLFTGSAIVVKASERTAWSSQYFTSIARASLAACGHSPQLVQSIVCWPPTANHLTSHPDISHITFIGSRPVAYSVCASAAKSLTPVCVELGGKDPAIILDDVKNLAKVTSILMRGVFQSAGQNCIGIERIIALPTIYPQLVSLLEARIRILRLGSALEDPEVDVGAMVSADSFSRLETLIDEAVAQGARLLVGGKRYEHPKYPKGHYFSPTLLVDVVSSMRIAQEECFAPICLLFRAESVSSAISLANSTEYALGASVFGSSNKDIDIIVSRVKAGMVSVNDFAVYYAVQLPFGGVGGSGYGRFAGEEGLRSICNTKSVCRDRWAGSTAIPGAVDYPIKNAEKAWEVCKGVVGLGYAERWSERLAALWGIIRNS
ncbi:Meiotic Sister-Chromatid recombination aldehyde dehydrogenase [Lambiella insularis]|nr:Meiotic Sister-Chromatid recombination aldehyde dehydrogenase [Lambiella insularis]